ncbi:MAG: type II secretion system F family protein [Nevskiaceae bacterium]|nr:MAG: type II secretion system F family protein [Nevskiaceae bacterium]
MSPALLSGVVALAVLIGAAALFAVGALLLRSRQQSALEKRISPTAEVRDEFVAEGEKPLLQNLARRGKSIEKMVDTEGESARLLLQAGWRSSEARMLWYIFQGALPLLVCGLLLAAWFFGPQRLHGPLFALMYLFVGAALSFLIPRWVLRGAAERRLARVKNEVPLFIHLLVLLFEAGLSSRQAFASMVRDGRGVLPELGREFDLVLRQLEAGADTGEVLKNLGDMLDVGDLNTVLAVLRQVDRYGGEVREPLLETLKVLEERRTLDLREKVNLMSGRMTIVMVMFFFPALLLFVAGPAFVSIIKVLGQINGH